MLLVFEPDFSVNPELLIRECPYSNPWKAAAELRRGQISRKKEAKEGQRPCWCRRVVEHTLMTYTDGGTYTDVKLPREIIRPASDHVTITFHDVTAVKAKSSMNEELSRRVRWRAPVIQATGRLRLADRLSSGALSCSGLCRSGVRTKFGIDMVLLGEPGTTRSSKEGCTGPDVTITFHDVTAVKAKSSMNEELSRRVRWRAPVIQATGRLRLADRLSSGALSCSGLCRSGVRTKFGIDMAVLIVAGDQANDSRVISKFDDGVGRVATQSCVNREYRERAEHTALGSADVESQGGGCGAAHPHSLWSSHQEVQDPVTEGGVETEVSELGDELGGHDGVEC
ncbi:hypothetical protein L3Q82_001696 [Scortum barcoo]|uniref:Uncharacterized protein n=1 Tax=Scortum barcoo TaxID=214431 RepID=A0ACB8W3Z5_9TELE|nr:hypothetical protein L3Q82_001696 [Scortum barcoo]